MGSRFNFTRKGFKTTPLDFIVLFVALIVLNLPGTPINSYHMSLIAAKMTEFFFGYEVLMGELMGITETLRFHSFQFWRS